MPYTVSPHFETEIVMSFSSLNVFEPNDHTEDYHIRKPKDEYFLFEIENKNLYLCEK